MDEIQNEAPVRKSRRVTAVAATDGAPAESTKAPKAAVAKTESAKAESTPETSSEGGASRQRRQRPPRNNSSNTEGSESAPKSEERSNDSDTQSERPQRQNNNGGGNRDRDRDFDDDRRGGNRNRNRNRYRDRDRRRGGNTGGNDRDEIEPEISPDDVLVPVAGILDVLDNYAFVRTTGYLPGPNDVYVSLGQVKKYGLRKGDAVVGAIRQPREGEGVGRQKFNAIVRIDSINGLTIEQLEERFEMVAAEGDSTVTTTVTINV
jgi:transcription termination factor Rho